MSQSWILPEFLQQCCCFFCLFGFVFLCFFRSVLFIASQRLTSKSGVFLSVGQHCWVFLSILALFVCMTVTVSARPQSPQQSILEPLCLESRETMETGCASCFLTLWLKTYLAEKLRDPAIVCMCGAIPIICFWLFVYFWLFFLFCFFWFFFFI